MIKLLISLGFVVDVCNTGSNVNIDQIYPKTQGEVWPQPQYQKKSQVFYTYSSKILVIKIVKHNCKKLAGALKRLTDYLIELDTIVQSRRSFYKDPKTGPAAYDPFYAGNLKMLRVNLTSKCDKEPYLHMDESYTLKIGTESIVTSNSIWGAMLGIETVSQLFYVTNDYTEVRVNATEITDYPSYAHRGLMLDTARHYISVQNILTTLDAMAMNKMNVFHWHIVDDESFPYQSEKLPEVSQKGAYHPTMVYSLDQIKLIIEFAHERGIRVIPEFDVTGYVRSWGLANPSILMACYDLYYEKYQLGPMHPLRVATYTFLKTLLEEVHNLFPDEYFHYGGDEFEMDCWSLNPAVQKFVEAKNLSSVSQIHSYFITNAMRLTNITKLPIIWQDLFQYIEPIDRRSIVQIWKADMVSEMINTMKNFVNRGVQIILSVPWYLDNEHNSFKHLYNMSPRAWVRDAVDGNAKRLILGGEACVWTEMIDDTNVISKSWPRTSAVAELLWKEIDLKKAKFNELYEDIIEGSNLDRQTSADAHVLSRAQEHTCRMRRRGVPAEPPIGPGFCVT